MTEFSIRNTFSEATSLLFKNFGTFFKAFLLAMGFIIPPALPYVIVSVFIIPEDPSLTLALLALVANIVYLIVSCLISIGLIKFTFDVLDNKEITYPVVYNQIQLLARFIGIGFVYTIMVLIGASLFIIPGLIAAFLFQFSFYLMIDKNLGIIDSFKESYNLVTKAPLKLILFTITSFIVSFSGFLVLGFGVIITSSIATLAGFLVYRTLINETVTTQEVVV